MKESKSIGERIKELREKKGVSQSDLAKVLGVSKQTIFKYENDIITNIPSDKIEKMAEYFHVTPWYLMGWDKQKTEFPIFDFFISGAERALIEAYRKSDMKAAVDTLLKLNQRKE